MWGILGNPDRKLGQTDFPFSEGLALRRQAKTKGAQAILHPLLIKPSLRAGIRVFAPQPHGAASLVGGDHEDLEVLVQSGIILPGLAGHVLGLETPVPSDSLFELAA